MKPRGRAVKEKVQVKAPNAKRWKKIVAVFDGSSAREHINPALLKELGVETDQPGETATLHVRVLGEEYSWPFQVSDLDWKRLGADVIFGEEFMGAQGVVLRPSPKGMKIEYAPGYPQGPTL